VTPPQDGLSKTVTASVKVGGIGAKCGQTTSCSIVIRPSVSIVLSLPAKTFQSCQDQPANQSQSQSNKSGIVSVKSVIVSGKVTNPESIPIRYEWSTTSGVVRINEDPVRDVAWTPAEGLFGQQRITLKAFNSSGQLVASSTGTVNVLSCTGLGAVRATVRNPDARTLDDFGEYYLEPMEKGMKSITASGNPEKTGYISFPSVPPGKYRLRVNMTYHCATDQPTVDVVAEQTTKVLVTVKPCKGKASKK
jgi:hypothetical protein